MYNGDPSKNLNLWCIIVHVYLAQCCDQLLLTVGGEQLLSRYSLPLPSGAVKPPISEPSATNLAWIKNPRKVKLEPGSLTLSTTAKKISY